MASGGDPIARPISTTDGGPRSQWHHSACASSSGHRPCRITATLPAVHEHSCEGPRSRSGRPTCKSEPENDVRLCLRIGSAEVEANQPGAVLAGASSLALPLSDWAGDHHRSKTGATAGGPFAPVSSRSPDPLECICNARFGRQRAGERDCVARADEAAVAEVITDLILEAPRTTGNGCR